MKIRNGFVSNSSSSSFVCDVCGNEQSGMDMCLSDANMCNCENDHTFCENEIVGFDSFDAYRESLEDDDCRWDVNEKYCPICTFKHFKDSNLLNYIIRKNSIDLTKIKEDIRTSFTDFKSFEAFIKG